MNVREIKERLNARALEVCELLLPGGKLENGKWICGDVHGAKGTSLKVSLQGQYAGTFFDWGSDAAEKSGDLIKLWQVSKNMEFSRAIEDIKQFLGIREEDRDITQGGPRPKPARRGQVPRDWRPVQEGSRVWKWLTETRRLSSETIRAFELGEFEGKHWDGNEHCCVVFPFFEMVWNEGAKAWRKGQLALVKFRDIENKGYERTGPKLDEGGKSLLFGMPRVPEQGRDLIITEGELDAMSLDQYGLPAVSIPFGAQPAKEGGELSLGHKRWLDECHKWLEHFENIYLAFDRDTAGQVGARQVAPRLGLERVKVLLMPGGWKDANEALKMGATADEIFDATRKARGFDPEELRSPIEMLDEIAAEMFPERYGEPLGDDLPFAMPFKLRPGEVTLVHGYNSHGKTVLLSFLLAWLAAKLGRKALIASLEIPARKLLRNILRQVFGRPRAADEKELRRWVEWQAQYFWAYAHVGQADLDRVLEVWRYGARRYGINYFVLDSLMMVAGLEGEDYDGQKAVMDKLLTFAATERVHVFLVAHDKKPDSRHPESKHYPGRYDVKGTGNLSDLAWNVLCIWRNKEKEEKLATAKELPENDSDRAKIENTWRYKEDALLVVQKQRETGEEPIKRLYFHAGPESSWQYREHSSDPVEPLVEELRF